MIRRILVVAGDGRALRMLPLLKAQGYEVRSLGLVADEARNLEDFQAEALLFPYPFSVKKELVPALNGMTIHPEDVLAAAGRSATVLAGAGLEKYIEAENARGKDLRPLRYEGVEAFLRANAEISAEATVFEAMALREEAMPDLNVLITGYGRYGRATARRLRLLGARVWVAARSEKQRQTAREDGMLPIELEQIARVAPRIHIAMNTIPARAIPMAAIEAFSKDCRLMELSSPPYGFDRAQAEALGLSLKLYPALPAKYAPQSAAKALAAACIHLLKEAQPE